MLYEVITHLLDREHRPDGRAHGRFDHGVITSYSIHYTKLYDHRDRIARVHAHGIQVFDRADDNAVVVAVPHDLHFEFLPADDRLFEQDLVGRRHFQSVRDDALEFLAVVGDSYNFV